MGANAAPIITQSAVESTVDSIVADTILFWSFFGIKLGTALSFSNETVGCQIEAQAFRAIAKAEIFRHDWTHMIETEEFKNVGRNEPCPCGSGKKFKKCHGENAPWQGNAQPISAAPTVEGEAPSDAPPAFDPSKMDLNWLAEFSAAIQRLPKGQLQQLQAIMQKGMHGKDVSRELETLQKRLPPSVQELLRKSPQLDAQLDAATGGASQAGEQPAELTEEQKARLQEIQKNNEKSGISRLWNRFRKK